VCCSNGPAWRRLLTTLTSWGWHYYHKATGTGCFDPPSAAAVRALATCSCTAGGTAGGPADGSADGGSAASERGVGCSSSSSSEESRSVTLRAEGGGSTRNSKPQSSHSTAVCWLRTSSHSSLPQDGHAKAESCRCTPEGGICITVEKWANAAWVRVCVGTRRCVELTPIRRAASHK